MILELTGKCAHFRKFFTNSSSSLSYYVPPRTVVAGMLSSILQIGRNEYYELFSPGVCGISVRICSPLKKHTECMNYLHEKWEREGTHAQCRLELVFPIEKKIVYRIYFYHADNSVYTALKKKIRKKDLGFGIYLGQRQFKGFIEYIKEIKQINHVKKADRIDSVIKSENIKGLDVKRNEEIPLDIISELMPVQMKKCDDNTRIKDIVAGITYERNGKSIAGDFIDCYIIEDRIISFT